MERASVTLGSRKNPWRSALGALALLVALSAPAWALNGNQHYPNGASDFLGGILPPQPGYYLINYTALIQKDRVMDKDGTKAANVNVDVAVEVPRFIWVSPYKVGGAQWGAQIFIPTYRANFGTGGPEDAGLGDIIINPWIFGWHFSQSFHMVTTLDIWAPTGDYQANNPATQILSRNDWTFEPVVALTYIAGPLDLSAKFMYDFNTKNKDPGGGAKELQPGQEFHIDYGVAYLVKPLQFLAGLSGYYYQQMTEDKVDGKKDLGGKARVAALGPTFRYWPNQGKWTFTAKHLYEFGGKNALEGNSTWLNLIYAF